MMPGKVPCLPDNLLGLSWHDSAWVPMLNPSNVLDYFSERTNPFYDRTCNNEIIKMQRLNPDQLVNMTGLEYMLLHVQEPILYVIRKLHRHSPTQFTPLADYYIIAGVVYQAPDLASVINSRLLTSVYHLQSAFDDLFTMARYHPSKGYSWDIKPQLSGGASVSGAAQPVVASKKEVKEEPSSTFQRHRVDMLLGELTRKFPFSIVKQQQSEQPEMGAEPPLIKQETKPEIKEEKMETIENSPSMKPPPEKKIKIQ